MLLSHIVLPVLLWASFRPYSTAVLWHRNGIEDSAELKVRSGIIIADRYQVRGPLGRGAFSRTFRCVDHEHETDVCVKVLKNGKETFDAGLAEIKVLSLLTERWNELKGDVEPPFVRLLDYAYYKEHLLIVTELLGESLEDHLRFKTIETTGGCFTPAVQAAQLTKLLETLEFMHDQGIAHCDVKPDNICIKIDDPTVIKLIDYGSCVFSEDILCSYMQSRWYRAPEVMLGVPGLDAKKMDVWSAASCGAAPCGLPAIQGSVRLRLCLPHSRQSWDPIQNTFLRIVALTFVGCTSHPRTSCTRSSLHSIHRILKLSTRLTPISTPLAQLLHAADPLMLDLLMSMLRHEPGARASVKEALAHPFIAKYKRSDQ